MKQAKPALSDPTLWNVKLATSSSLHLPQLNTIQLHYHLHSASVVFSTHAADTSKSNCAHVCGETTSQPPAGLGAGCYLAGQLGFGGVVWASGRSEKGWSISGAELLLENRDISDLILPEIHSVTGGEKKGCGGRESHRSPRCSSRPLGGNTAKHSPLVPASLKWRRSRLSKQSVSATVSFNSPSNQSQHRQTDWGWFLFTHALREDSEKGWNSGVSHAQCSQSSDRKHIQLSRQ